MWNDTDEPLAYFITFRCYGTWLHGDERGSTDRYHNLYRSPKIPGSAHWHDITERRMKHPPVYLNAARRKAVERAIRDTCEKRGWIILAINVRTNHVHVVVVYARQSSSVVLIALKANATREMRESGLWNAEHSPWAQKGSKRKLWNQRSVNNAIDYVENGQGDDLPDFDHD